MLSCRMKTRTRSQDENRDLTIYFINRQSSVSTSSHRSPSPPHGPDRRVRNINSNWQYSSDQGQCWPGRRLVQQASLDASGSTRQHCDTDEPDSRLLEQGTGCESIQTGLAVKKRKKKKRKEKIGTESLRYLLISLYPTEQWPTTHWNLRCKSTAQAKVYREQLEANYDTENG